MSYSQTRGSSGDVNKLQEDRYHRTNHLDIVTILETHVHFIIPTSPTAVVSMNLPTRSCQPAAGPRRYSSFKWLRQRRSGISGI